MAAWVGEHKPLEDSVSVTTFQVWWEKGPYTDSCLTRESGRKDCVDGDEGPHIPFDLDFASQSRQEAAVRWPSTPLVSTGWPGCSPRATVLSLAFTQETRTTWEQTRERSGLRSSRSPGCMLRAESRKEHTASYRAFVGSSHKGVRNNRILNVILKVEPIGIVKEFIRKITFG